MPDQTIRGVNALTGEGVELDFSSTIHAVRTSPTLSPATYVAPAFLDLQVNGFAGVDYGSPQTTLDDIRRSIEAQFATGVTRMLPTVITGSRDGMVHAIRNLARAKASWGTTGEAGIGEAMVGLHIEGPHISPEDGPRGAHPRGAVRAPSIEEFQGWQEASGGLVKMVTLAPEWPGAPKYIEYLVQHGAIAAIGHTAATAAQIDDAISAGATMATHLGNATFSTPPKFNPLWDQMADDRLTVSVIADGFHVPASFLKTALRTKSAKRLVLVTDAAAPAGARPGRYRLGEVDVELGADGRVTLADGTRLAGSALRMDRAVSHMMSASGATLAEGMAMASLNPARVIGRASSGLAPGEWADFIEFSLTGGSIVINRVWMAGQTVYNAL